MENNSNTLSVIQLVALVEAGKFPIGCVGSDDLAQRLYDAWSVLIARSCVHARQAAIARRDINQAMSEMGNNQGGYHIMERCLEQMRAQEGVDAPAIVLTMQLNSELRDLCREFNPEIAQVALHGFVIEMEAVVGIHSQDMTDTERAVAAAQIHALRGVGTLLRTLQGFLPTEACMGVAS